MSSSTVDWGFAVSLVLGAVIGLMVCSVIVPVHAEQLKAAYELNEAVPAHAKRLEAAGGPSYATEIVSWNDYEQVKALGHQGFEIKQVGGTAVWMQKRVR